MKAPKVTISNHRTETCKDVFLSHASRDKDPYVRKLAQELDRIGISYWLDHAEVKWGDKISKKINEGLRNSRYVIVFLSENFLGRNWPEAELEAALSKENADGETVVLPLILGDTAKILTRYPLLRDKLYLEWDNDLSAISSHLTTLLNAGGSPNLPTAPRPEALKKGGDNIRPPALQRHVPKNIMMIGVIGGGLLLLILSVGTYFFFERHNQPSQNNDNQSVQNSNVAPPVSIIGEELIATVDVNLRNGPASTYGKIGLVERGSRVRVVRAEGKWLQVQVVVHARPKDDATSLDEGWVAGMLFSLPDQ